MFLRAISYFRLPPAPYANVKPRFYLPQLDGLRFFAFLLVFFHHYAPVLLFFPPSLFERKLFTFQTFGWVGVDIFLTLSAFLIFTLLLAEHAREGTISIRLFYIRRALRIWPLYYPYVLLAFLLAFLEGSSWFGLRSHVLPALLFLLNFSYAQYRETVPPIIEHLWTISLEEQFYLIAPLTVYFWATASKRFILLGLLGLLAVTVGSRAYVMLTAPASLAVWVSPFCRLDPLLVGASLALMYHRRPDIFQRWRGEWPAAASIALFVLVASFPNIRMSLHTIWQLSADALAGGLLIAAILGRGWVGRLCSWQPLCFLGKISFGLYVFHELCLHYAPVVFSSLTKHTPGNWCLGFVESLMVTILIGSASYHLYERHFLRLKRCFEIVPTRPA